MCKRFLALCLPAVMLVALLTSDVFAQRCGTSSGVSSQNLSCGTGGCNAVRQQAVPAQLPALSLPGQQLPLPQPATTAMVYPTSVMQLAAPRPAAAPQAIQEEEVAEDDEPAEAPGLRVDSRSLMAFCSPTRGSTREVYNPAPQPALRPATVVSPTAIASTTTRTRSRLALR